MNNLYITLLICLPFFGSCQKKQIFSFEHKEFNNATLEYLKTNNNNGEKTIVMFRNSCYDGPYYFIFKKFKEYPKHLKKYLDENNKFLKVSDYSIPLITDADYELYSNQGFVDGISGYADGSTWGRSNRLMIVMENDRGKFGRIIPKEELLDH